MKSFFIYSKEGSDFEYSPDHPFRPERTDMTFELSKKYGLFDEPWISIVPPEPIPEETLLIFHTERYLNALKAAGKGEITEDTVQAGLGTSDNPIFPDMFEKSNLAAGGTIVGMRHVLETDGKARSFNTMGGFHHAFPDYAEGFCYINDLCIAGRLLRKDGKRFCYIDVDAHHGNAVEHAFFEDDGALVISMHQSGHTLYPGTGFENEIGRGKGRGTNINIPLPPQTDDDLALKAFYEIVPPAVEAFSPDLIIAQLGVDSVASDPLANLSLTNNSFERMVQEICSITDKLVATGGGGYNVDNVSRSWTLAWAAINGIELVNPYAGLIGGLLAGPEIEGGGLTDMHIYVTGPTKERNTKEIDRIITYLKETIFPIIGAKG